MRLSLAHLYTYLINLDLYLFTFQYGDIVALVVSPKKNGSALVEFKTKDAAVSLLTHFKDFLPYDDACGHLKQDFFFNTCAFFFLNLGYSIHAGERFSLKPFGNGETKF